MNGKDELKSSTMVEMGNERIDQSSRTPNQSNMLLPEKLSYPTSQQYFWMPSSLPYTLFYNRKSPKIWEGAKLTVFHLFLQSSRLCLIFLSPLSSNLCLRHSLLIDSCAGCDANSVLRTQAWATKHKIWQTQKTVTRSTANCHCNTFSANFKSSAAS